MINNRLTILFYPLREIALWELLHVFATVKQNGNLTVVSYEIVAYVLN